VIVKAIEHENPKVPGGLVLELIFEPNPGESYDDFQARIERLPDGLHQMEFKQVNATYRLAIELNPSFGEPEPEDFSKLDKAELLRDLDAAPVSRVKNKLDYSEGG